SNWLGAPAMCRKITRRALGANCGGSTASGCAAEREKSSRCGSAAPRVSVVPRNIAPKPVVQVRRKCRRVCARSRARARVDVRESRGGMGGGGLAAEREIEVEERLGHRAQGGQLHGVGAARLLRLGVGLVPGQRSFMQALQRRQFVL